MYPPTFKRALIEAAEADAVRSARHAHHHREWELQHGSPLVRRLRRLLLVRSWRLARRLTVRRDQAVTGDSEVQPSVSS